MSDVLGGYRLTELIGRGASGRVWRATKLEDGTVVALKVLHEDLADDPDVRERFEAEASWMTDERLPGVVRVHEVVFDQGRLALVMDLIEGTDLRRLMVETGPVGVGEVCTIGAQVATGLAGAHSVGVIHRDVKPENVLVQEQEHGSSAWITDFGVARLVDGPSRTRASRIVGTTDYVAPEVLSGQPATLAVDVYALGIMLFEAVVGWRPFRGDHAAAVMQQHLHAPLLKPDGFPESLWSLVERCLSRDPFNRPTASEVAADLGVLSADLTDFPPLPLTAAPPPAPIDPPSGAATAIRGERRPSPGGREAAPARASRVRPVIAATVAALLLVLGITGAVFAVQGRSEESIVETAASSGDPRLTTSSLPSQSIQSSAEAERAAQESAAQESAKQQAAAEESARQSSAAQQSAAQEAARLEAERLAAEQQEAERLAAEKQEAERLAAESREAEGQDSEAAAVPSPQAPAAAATQAPAAPAPAAPAQAAPAAPTPAAPAPTAPAPARTTPKPAPQTVYFTFPAKENLNGRSTKNVNEQGVVDMYKKGDPVRVKCQASGGEAYGSTIWDFTAEGVWVPDRYVKTGTDGWAPGVPRC